jgi:hypothetical protein
MLADLDIRRNTLVEHATVRREGRTERFDAAETSPESRLDVDVRHPVLGSSLDVICADCAILIEPGLANAGRSVGLGYVSRRRCDARRTQRDGCE